jgi:MFS family permease
MNEAARPLTQCSLATISPLYISEIAPPEIRGALLVLQELSIVLGIVIAFWTTYGTRFMAGEWSWRLPFLFQMIPGFVLGIGIFFLPFSPRWLSSKGRDAAALQVLSKLRRLPTSDPRVFQEWCEIRAEVAFKQEINRERHPNLQAPTRANRFKLEAASWADCFRRGCWKRTLVGVGVMFFQQFVRLPQPTRISSYSLYSGRHQRPHLLQPFPLPNPRPRLRNATPPLRCH